MKYIVSQKTLQKIKDQFPADVFLAVRSMEGKSLDYPDDLLLKMQEKLTIEYYNRYHIKLLDICKKPNWKDFFCLNLRQIKFYRRIDPGDRFALWMLGGIVMLALLYPKVLLPLWAPETLPNAPGTEVSYGTFGDSFGALNTLFSGLAFAGLIWTILLQKKELKETREEIKGQKEQLANQYLVMKKDNFENTFFRLLSFQRDIVASLTIKETFVGPNSKTVTHNGHDCLEKISNQLPDYFDERCHAGIYPDLEPYERFYKIHDKNLSHYHKHLYQIILFIESSDIADDEKDRYRRLLRAQFSSAELVLLLFHCISSYGKEKFKPLLEKYKMLEHLPVNKYLEEKKESLTQYQKKVFGDNEYYLDFYNS